jgi:hypothetical protein
VLADALKQVPSRFRRRILVRVDGAGASHDLVKHLLSLNSKRKTVLFTTGWMITGADEDAIGNVPAGALKPGTCQDGSIEEDKDTAEITGLLSRTENWPDGLRWIVRRVKPGSASPSCPHPPDQHGQPTGRGRRSIPARSEPVHARGTPGTPRTPRPAAKRTRGSKTEASTISNRPSGCLND